MKRDIKFRGKRIDNGEWVYGDLTINRPTQTFWIITDGILVKHGDYTDDRLHGFAGYVCNVDKSTVGQFTGLKDKNGVEIYEGDVINHYRNGYEVVSYGIQNVDAFEGVGFNLWDFYGDLNDLGKGIRLQSSIEVIGNIHDNPELIANLE